MTCLAFSPDGAILAGGWTADPRRTPAPGDIRFLDFAHGKELRRFGSFPGDLGWLAFAPDGKTLASAGSGEPVVRLWDVATGREVFTHPGHVMGISELAVSPADGTIFTGSDDGTLRRWDPASGRELGVVARFKDGVGALAVAPDGKTLLLHRPSEDRVLWSLTEQRELGVSPARSMERPASGSPFLRTDNSWSPIGGSGMPRPAMCASFCARNGRKEVLPWCTAFFAPDGEHVITAEPGGVWIWDIASGRDVRQAVKTNKIRASGVALSADGRFLATGGYFSTIDTVDTTIRIWELASGKEVATLPGHDGAISELAFSPNGRLLASHYGESMSTRDIDLPYLRDQMIRILDLSTGRELRRLDGHRGTVNVVAFAPDGRSIVSGSTDATAVVWDISDLNSDQKAGAPLGAVVLKARWDELAGDDAGAAYRAVWSLSVPSAVPFLRDRLGPATTVEPMTSPEVLRRLRSIAALERINTPEAHGVVEQLANGDPGAPETCEAKATLERLKR